MTHLVVKKKNKSPKTQTVIANTISHQKEARLLRETAEHRSGAGNIQMSLEHLVMPKAGELLKPPGTLSRTP